MGLSKKKQALLLLLSLRHTCLDWAVESGGCLTPRMSAETMRAPSKLAVSRWAFGNAVWMIRAPLNDAPANCAFRNWTNPRWALSRNAPSKLLWEKLAWDRFESRKSIWVRQRLDRFARASLLARARVRMAARWPTSSQL